MLIILFIQSDLFGTIIIISNFLKKKQKKKPQKLYMKNSAPPNI